MKGFFLLIVFCLCLPLSSGSATSPPQARNSQFCVFDETGAQGDQNSNFGPSDSATVAMIARIMNNAGLPQNFTVRSYDSFNAEARIVEGEAGTKRYILYNANFLKQVKDASQSDWGPMGVLAHEVAHHLMGHTIEQLVTNPDLELQADRFAGFVLCKLDATLVQAQSGFTVFSDLQSPGSTHPARDKRLKAVEDGWQKAKTLGGGGGSLLTAQDRLFRLFYAASGNDVVTTKAMLDLGVGVNSVNGNGSTPLAYAVTSNAADTVALLLDRGADPNLGTAGDVPPLFHAVEQNSIRIISLLIAHHVNVNAQVVSGYGTMNALGYAVGQSINVFKVTSETIALLVKAGIDVNLTAGYMGTPLHFAVSFKQYDAVKELLKSNNVRVNATDKEGWTPMDHVQPRSDIEDLLKHAGGRRIKNR